MKLEQDIALDSEAFRTAANEMSALKTRAELLKAMMEQMYEELAGALDTPAGKAIEITAKDILIKPIEELILVIGQMSKTLNEIIDTPYYQGVFDKYEKLIQNINFN
ncbi:hypothetical protein IMSAGC003_03066 [Lachnospiraceae bacterium]|nr:hypothetical protein [Lachnospiraceae bacterium]GFH96509.1 hypothetical protein IMSAGC003_03066 [Lachnospiraceae bacterium]